MESFKILHPDHDRLALDDRQSADSDKRFCDSAIGGIVEAMKIRGTLSPSCPSGWMTEEMPILEAPKISAILARTPGLVHHVEGTKILRDDVINRHHRAVAFMGNKRRNAVFRPNLRSSAAFRQIAQYGAGCGVLAAPRP